jgi:hypothetical protein
LPTGGAGQLRDKVYSPTRGQFGFLFSLSYKEAALLARPSRRMAASTNSPVAVLRDARASARSSGRGLMNDIDMIRSVETRY